MKHFLSLIFFIFSWSSFSYGSLQKDTDIALQEIVPLQFEQTNQTSLFHYYDKHDDTHWFKYKLSPEQQNIPIILTVSNMNFQELSLFEKYGDSLLFVERTGNNFRSLKEETTRFNQFKITTTASEIYLRAKINNFSLIDLEVATVDEFYKKESKSFLYLGLYYGIVIMSLIFNIVFYFVFKDKRFITYSLLLFSVAMMFLYEDGLFSFLTTNPWLLNNFTMITSPVTALIACIFTYYFLELKKYDAAFIRRVCPVLSLSFLFALLFFIFRNNILLSVCNIFNFIAALLCCHAAIKLFRKEILARFLIFTLGMVLLFGLLYNLHQYGVLEAAMFGRNTFKLASSFEIITISFAIIYKIRKVRAENTHFKTEIKRYIQELETEKNKVQPISSVPSDTEISLADLVKKFNLTERELQVLEGINNGLSNQEIAAQLFLSLSTVKFHIGNLYSKLDIKNRTQAIKLLHRK